VLELLAQHPNLTAAQVAQRLKVTRQRAHAILAHLRARDLVAHDSPASTQPARWRALPILPEPPGLRYGFRDNA
jgi:predicted ArsR family transcriptional regulator